jgi:hypothetical protein
MNIFESMAGSSDTAAVKQLAAQFGLRPEQASAAVGALLPAVAAGLKRNLATDSAAAQLESALAGGRHVSYVEQPEVLANPETVIDGNAILGHIFGGKEVSRQVATNASQKTGIDPAILKKMLPLVAALAMGGLAKQSKTGAGATNRTGIGAMLEPLLDRDRDGSAIDDVAGMLGGLLGRKG